MIREFNFRFDELVINKPDIVTILGYSDSALPSPFDGYFDQALEDAQHLTDIKARYRIIENTVINETRHTILADGLEFKAGKTICSEMKGAKRIAFFICTAGKTISDKSAEINKSENPVLSYIYDVLGSSIAEAAGDRMQALLKDEVEKSGEKITNRYSPGYCQWAVSDQHKLFSLFHGETCGVTLTPSALMQPAKSISGIIGVGRDIIYRDYQCELCSSKNCVYRKDL